jgi:hypothetical protein
MNGNRALCVAIAARDQVVANPELRAAQEKAWRKFVRHVWGGPAVRPADPSKPSEQFHGEYDDRMALDGETVRR